MATAQELYDSAIERSNLNDADLVSSTEWLAWISSLEARVYIVAAKENPDFFGKEANTVARTLVTETWTLTTAPGNIAAVSRFEVSAITGTVSGIAVGDEVYAVSIRDVDTAIAPRVYVRDKVVHEYNSELSTDASNLVTTLKVFYSHLPSLRTATTDPLDLPDEYNQLIVVPLAAMLAQRDQRPEETQVLNAEFALDFTNFIQHVSVFDEVVVRDLDKIPASSTISRG